MIRTRKQEIKRRQKRKKEVARKSGLLRKTVKKTAA